MTELVEKLAGTIDKVEGLLSPHTGMDETKMKEEEEEENLSELEKCKVQLSLAYSINALYYGIPPSFLIQVIVW